MRNRVWTWAGGVVRRGTAAFRPRVVILLYHRVVESDSDPLLLRVTPSRFQEQMEWLRKSYPVVSLRELVSLRRQGIVPKRAVVVTFDDGYADNLHHAKPVLERFDIPATVYVTSGLVDSSRGFWWDELSELMLRPRSFPERIRLLLGRKEYEWAMAMTPRQSREKGDWNVSHTEDLLPQQRAFREMHRLLRAVSVPEREELLSSLARQLCVERRTKDEDRVLHSQEIRTLAEGGLVEIGAHSVTHPVLTKIEPDARRAEMTESREALEKILDRPVVDFAYPYGGPDDVGDRTPRLAREVGFETACMNYAIPMTFRSDLFRLPRCMVRNWDRNEFAHYLTEYFFS